MSLNGAGDCGRRKRSRSASAIIADTASGYHILKIDGYSRTKRIPTEACLKSSPFTVGGHRWHIDYHPNGVDAESKDYISLYLMLDKDKDPAKRVMAQHLFRFVGEVAAEEEEHAPPPALLALQQVDRFRRHEGWGESTFVSRAELEMSPHLKDDSFAIRCDIVVVDEFRTEDQMAATVSAPPPDLRHHLGDLLQTGKGADVVFEVGGGFLRIDDMDARVFKALLHYVYTDLFPESMEEDGKEDEGVMAQHLLVTADRYSIESLKLICEERLCRYIDASSVSTILALAEQHQCFRLKKACFDFLRSPANLKVVIATESFDHLSKSCPSIMKELVALLGT